MVDSVLSEGERKLLSELASRGVRYLVIGMSAALLQGARGATEDIDLAIVALEHDDEDP